MFHRSELRLLRVGQRLTLELAAVDGAQRVVGLRILGV